MWQLFTSNIKMTYRNKQALFWTLMFPLMFTFIFGMFFGSDNISGGTIALIKNSDTQLANSIEKTIKDSDVFKINSLNDRDEAKKQIEQSKINAAVVIPAGFGEQRPDAPTKIEIISDPANSTTNSALNGLMNGVLTHVNYEAAQVKPIFSIEETKTNTRKLTYFDFILVGLIGMALMNSSVQGVAIAFSKYREDKILKRITTTPLPTWKLIVADILSRLILNFVQVTLILLIGVYLFKAHIYGNIFLIYLFSLIGALLFQTIGYAVVARAKTTQAAESIATAVTIPMMFLAGVFFPIDQLPKWLLSIVQYLPLAPLLRIIRGIALDNASPLVNPFNLIVVVAWIVVMLFFAITRFKMSEE